MLAFVRESHIAIPIYSDKEGFVSISNPPTGRAGRRAGGTTSEAAGGVLTALPQGLASPGLALGWA